jgi:uncharacterized membrane protein
MAFLYTEPVMIVPILLLIIILILIIAIFVIAMRNRRTMRSRREGVKRVQTEVDKMRKLASVISLADIKNQEMKAKEEIKEKKVEEVKKDGDETIYDDRKNVSTWQAHLSKTYKDMKKKNSNAKFSDAMKAAKKTYKKKAKK